MAEPEQPVTLESIHLILLKIEKDARETKANVKRHDNRFKAIEDRLTAIEGRLGGIEGRSTRIEERLNDLEEALDIEKKETGGSIGERLERLERQVENINNKLKAG